MSKADVKRMLKSCGIPCIHMAWPENSAPELPWAVFYLEEEWGFDADDTRFAKASDWCVELYQRTSDEGLETRLEQAIQDSFGTYDKTEAWLDSENAIATTYTFRQIS